MGMSHADCTHERTPKGRAACRAQQREFDRTMSALRDAKTPMMDDDTRAAASAYLAANRGPAGDGIKRGAPKARKIEPTPVKGLSKVTDDNGTVVDWTVTPELVAKVQAKVTARAKRTTPGLRVPTEVRAAADQADWRDARRSARRAAMALKTRPLVPSADGRDYSSCVQADLHRGTGRCACGWHA